MEAISIEGWADIRELVLMSIGTDKGSWWADTSFGSELWLLRQSGKVTASTAETLKRMVLESLRWLITDGLAADISCETERTGRNGITYAVTVYKPDGDTVLIKDTWDAIQ